MSVLDIYNHKKFCQKMTLRQKKLVLGCLIGRGSIIKPRNRNCYFYARQSKREDVNILAFKAASLEGFGRPTAIVEDKNSIKWYSNSHPVWNELYEMCYAEGKKKISIKWLDELSSISFAMIFLDTARDGKTLELNISSFKEDGQLIKKYFNEIGLECDIKNTRIVFLNNGTEGFLKIIAQDVPNYLLYRLQQYIP